MKSFRIIFSLIFVVVMASCNNQNKVAEVEPIAPEKDAIGYEQKEADTDSLTVENPGLPMGQEKVQVMYEELNMTDDQIYSFETQYKKKLEKSPDTDHVGRKKFMDESIQEVLSREQYEYYKSWINDNF